MKTSLLTPASVLLCLATPPSAMAADLSAPLVTTWQDKAMQPWPDATYQPASLALPKLSLNQALRAANLAAPALTPPAEWLAQFQRLSRTDGDSPPAMPDSSRRAAIMMSPG